MISKSFLILGALVAASSASVGGYYIHKNITSKKEESPASTTPKNQTSDVTRTTAGEGEETTKNSDENTPAETQ